MNNTEWVTFREAADETGIPLPSLYRYLANERIAACDVRVQNAVKRVKLQTIIDLAFEKVCPECQATFLTLRENKEFCKRKHMHRYNIRLWLRNCVL